MRKTRRCISGEGRRRFFPWDKFKILFVSCLKEYGWWKEPAEATIEANPGTVDAEKLKALREIGFERISLGVQSLQNNELRALGRIHSAEEALRAIEEAKLAGFQRVNADLMSGIPCQTVESFRDTMNQILQMNLSHISAYSLILEEGTPMERLVASGRVTLPDEDISYLMYEMTTEILAQAGLRRYEISNYAKPGQESLHNIVYWHYPITRNPARSLFIILCTGIMNLTRPSGWAPVPLTEKNGGRIRQMCRNI